MDNVFIALLVASFLFALIVSYRSMLHMLQLSSYQFPGYFKTAFTLKRQLPYIIMFLIALTGMLIPHDVGYIDLLVATVLFCVFGFLTLPKPEKKKFVCTARVTRLYVTLFILTAIVIALVMRFNMASIYPVMMYWYVLSAETVFFAACINYPIEKTIQASFISQAVKKLSEMPQMLVIGVTGSYGKTSVKNYLCELLREGFETFITPKSYNTPMGIVRAIRENMRATDEVFVCEMGARHVGDIAEVCAIASPDWGIITSIGEQHLETFKSFENIKSTKLELAASVAEKDARGAKLFINGDSVTDAKELYPQAITYGISEQNDAYAADISHSASGTSFTFRYKEHSVRYTTELLGIHAVLNIVGALCVAVEMGISPETLIARVRRLSPIAHRLELKRNGNNIIIDDAFNSNPEGAKAALDVLKDFDGARILITPGMVELGVRQSELNTELGAHAARCCDYAILVGKTNSQSIAQGLRSAGFSKSHIFTFDEFKAAYDKANAISATTRIILIENDLPDNY